MELVTRTTFGRPKGQEPKPKRPCRDCKAPLSHFNPSTICSRCNGGSWEEGEPTPAQVKKLRVARLEEMGMAA